MPRPRFTIRRMMVAVAIVGIVLGIERFLFACLAARHSHYGETAWRVVKWDLFCINVFVITLLYRLLAGKLTARYLWLPVAPDPPEPE